MKDESAAGCLNCTFEVIGIDDSNTCPVLRTGDVVEVKGGRFEAKGYMWPMHHRLYTVEDLIEYLAGFHERKDPAIQHLDYYHTEIKIIRKRMK